MTDQFSKTYYNIPRYNIYGSQKPQLNSSQTDDKSILLKNISTY